MDERWLAVQIIRIANNRGSVIVTGEGLRNNGGHEKVLDVSGLVDTHDCRELGRRGRQLALEI
jgi:hypothetical protein